MSSKLSFIILLFRLPFLHRSSLYYENLAQKCTRMGCCFLRFEIIRNLIQQLLVTLDSAVQAEGHIKYYNILRSITFFLPLPITIYYYGWDFPRIGTI